VLQKEHPCFQSVTQGKVGHSKCVTEINPADKKLNELWTGG